MIPIPFEYRDRRGNVVLLAVVSSCQYFQRTAYGNVNIQFLAAGVSLFKFSASLCDTVAGTNGERAFDCASGLRIVTLIIS